MEKGGDPLNPFAAPDDDAKLSMDLDLDLDGPPALASARPTVKFQPKLKGKRLPKPEPSSEPDAAVPVAPGLRPVKKEEEGLSAGKAEEVDVLGGGAIGYETKVQEKLNGGVAAMDVDRIEEEEDMVVREIDVYFNPSPLDTDTELYVIQYPLRPHWRPYDLNELCQEVRMKPKQSQIEFVMDMDVDSENYDNEVDERLRLQKQVLSSSRVPYVTGYAVGMLVGNQLHLNPIHAVMQLRPSMAHVDACGLHKKHIAQSAGVTNPDEEKGEESAKPSTSRGKAIAEASNEDVDDSEDWISLKYHRVDSPISNGYQNRMLSKDGDHIAFLMSPHDYLNCLCPIMSADNKPRGPSRRALLSMPLHERLKTLFMEGPPVHRFDALMHLAPSESADVVLKIIQQHAVLVQGLWVSKSPLPHGGNQAIVREYILFLFTKKNTIPNGELKEKIKNRIDSWNLKQILNPLAFERSVFNDWKFKEPTDLSFIKRYPEIVKMQESFWSHHQEYILDALRGPGSKQPAATKGSMKPSSGLKNTATCSVDQNPKRGNEAIVTSGLPTMSDEIREALPKALTELFRNHRVCSMNQIRQGLREMAVSKSTLPKADPRLFVLAAHGASAPVAELEPIICKVAEKIHDVYVPKSGSNLALNPLRNVVISLLRGKPRTEKLKKAEILAAVEMVLKKQFSAADYNQVLNELCVSFRGAGWLLKSGDEMPN